jgi:hypothetical protein
MVPAWRRSRLDRAQHRELGAVQLPDDRDVRERPERGLVGRRQVVQMEQIRCARARERFAPDENKALVGVVADGREHAVRRARPILVGGWKRNRSGERVGTRRHRRVVDRQHLDTGKERRGVRRLARRSERARDKRRPPVDGGQPRAERAGDLRRAATGKEKERADDATAVIDVTDTGRPTPPTHPHPNLLPSPALLPSALAHVKERQPLHGRAAFRKRDSYAPCRRAERTQRPVAGIFT